jgi:flagellar biosynthesis protein
MMQMPERCPNLPNAVALAYREQGGAPRVVAKGNGAIAEEIIRRAREAGVHVHESRELVGLLMQVDLDREIPPLLYTAIAELLAWVYRLEEEAGALPS